MDTSKLLNRIVYYYWLQIVFEKHSYIINWAKRCSKAMCGIKLLFLTHSFLVTVRLRSISSNVFIHITLAKCMRKLN